MKERKTGDEPNADPQHVPGAKHTTEAYVTERGASGAPDDASGMYQLLVESVIDYAIFALSPNGMILSCNAGAQHFKGYRSEEIIGRHFSVFYPAARSPARTKVPGSGSRSAAISRARWAATSP
ncbi:MAG: PAS domain-containing protein [bacterium]